MFLNSQLNLIKQKGGYIKLQMINLEMIIKEMLVGLFTLQLLED
jgi:hypothetical protein